MFPSWKSKKVLPPYSISKITHGVTEKFEQFRQIRTPVATAVVSPQFCARTVDELFGPNCLLAAKQLRDVFEISQPSRDLLSSLVNLSYHISLAEIRARKFWKATDVAAVSTTKLPLFGVRFNKRIYRSERVINFFEKTIVNYFVGRIRYVNGKPFVY